jgi:hypothetical protein
VSRFLELGWEDLLHFGGSAEKALVTCKLPLCETDGWFEDTFRAWILGWEFDS